MQKPSSSGSWFVDDPIEGFGSEEDALDRTSFVESAASILNRVGGQASSTVIALIGPWGSGKTSTVNQARALLVDQNELGWKFVDFNPWSYQDQASLQTGFFIELSSALPKRLGWGGARRKIAALGDSIAPLASLGALAGFDASSLVRGASRLIGGDKSPSGLRRKAEAAFRIGKKPVLVIIDDLDRLDPSELLLVFKLVRLVGRLPYVHYLICYDEATLEDSIGRTGLVGSDPAARARDYLEKVVQIRLDLPALRDSQSVDLVNQKLGAFLDEAGVELMPRDRQRFSKMFYDHLHSRLNTPRSINRYFTQLASFFSGVRDEIDLVDYLLLTWVRTAEPGVYRLIQKRKSDLIGYKASFGRRSDNELNSTQARWRREIEESGTRERDIEGVAAVLSSLFPAFGSAWLARESTRSVSAPLRLSHPDYFDRYFHFGVPHEDIGDAEVAAAIEQINEGAERAEARKLTLMLGTRSELILGKLKFRQDSGELQPDQFLVWLADNFHTVAYTQGLLTPREQIRYLASSLLRSVRNEDLARVMQRMTTSRGGVELATYAFESLGHTEEDQVPSRFTFELKHQLSAALTKQFDSVGNVEPFSFPTDLWSLIWLWDSIDNNAARSWIEGQIGSRRWTTLDATAKFVGTSTLVGGVGPDATSLSDLDTELVDRLIGLDVVLERLSAELDAAPVAMPPRHELTPTPDNRRLITVITLAKERERRRF